MPDPQRRQFQLLIQSIPSRVIVKGRAKPHEVNMIRATVPADDLEGQAFLRQRGFRWLHVGQVWHLQLGGDCPLEEIDALEAAGFTRCEERSGVEVGGHQNCMSASRLKSR